MQTNGTHLDRPVALIILDGWGYAPRTERNAIAMAHTPYYDEICSRASTALLTASGVGAGLAEDEPGSAEVGHLNLGTGRPAQTEVSRIRNAVASGEFMDNPVLNDAFLKAKSAGSDVHFVGLVSDAGIHSSTENLFALLRLAKNHGLSDVYIHAILDGVDAPPRTADVYVEAIEIKLADIGLGKIATLCGRYWAMDTSDNWERTARAFTMLVHAEGERTPDAVTAVRNSFLRGISDEFVAPVVIESSPDTPLTRIKNGDLVVFFNHRGDTMRQLVRSVAVAEGMSGAKPVIDTVCLTEYDKAFDLPVAFPSQPETGTLVDALSSHAIPTVKITEAARFQHLTSLFDGGSEDQGPFEEYALIAPATPDVADHWPESQSFKIADKVARGIEDLPGRVFVANLPAADLMAETGDLDQTLAAIQYMDTCLGGICEMVERAGGVALVTSTHGRCEDMVDDGSGETTASATQNPVPLHLLDFQDGHTRLSETGSLADVAPTILGIIGIDKPSEMTGSDLRLL